MRTPGRPVEATVHPRTRPEGEEIARRNRTENDWFRHDGKNVEPPPPGHVRLTVSCLVSKHFWAMSCEKLLFF